ncbi:hypothetical protein AWN76_002510 [Rhodothermaceae bacterium RA]|nr:hypothetical protein AWN76_002510 [Rhodothermaceae bacterium RA]
MMPELLAQVPTLALIALVFYLAAGLRRERRRQAERPAAGPDEALLKRLDQLSTRVDELSEQAWRLEERLAEAMETARHNHERIAKHRTALERFGMFLEDELNRIDRGLADVQARVNALTLPDALRHAAEDEELAEYEIASLDAAA